MRTLIESLVKGMRLTFELGLSSFLFYSGLLFLYLKLPANKRRTPILLYHEIGDEKSGLPEGVYVRPEYFKKQVKYLIKHYHFISMDTLAKAFRGELPLSDPSISYIL